MNTQEAHQIANPEILKFLNGCGRSLMVYTCRKDNICYSCKSVLKGILISQEKEAEFLGVNIEGRIKLLIESGYKELNGLLFEMNKRLEAIKISNKDLKEKIK